MNNKIEYHKKPLVVDRDAQDYLLSEGILKEDNFIYNPRPTFDDCKGRAIYGSVLGINTIPAYSLLQCIAIVTVKGDELEAYHINL